MPPLDAPPPIPWLVESYLRKYADEADHLAPLLAFLDTYRDYDDQIRRSNMAGHLTVSGLIIDQSLTRVLLIEHRTLGRRLQPGGHIEASDASLLAAVYREIREETGLVAKDLRQLTRRSDRWVPVDINSHLIPASSAKGEAEHLHHDLRYLFALARPQPDVLHSPEDGTALAWETFEAAFSNDSQQNLPRKLHELLRGA